MNIFLTLFSAIFLLCHLRSLRAVRHIDSSSSDDDDEMAEWVYGVRRPGHRFRKNRRAVQLLEKRVAFSDQIMPRPNAHLLQGPSTSVAVIDIPPLEQQFELNEKRPKRVTFFDDDYHQLQRTKELNDLPEFKSRKLFPPHQYTSTATPWTMLDEAKLQKEMRNFGHYGPFGVEEIARVAHERAEMAEPRPSTSHDDVLQRALHVEREHVFNEREVRKQRARDARDRTQREQWEKRRVEEARHPKRAHEHRSLNRAQQLMQRNSNGDEEARQIRPFRQRQQMGGNIFRRLRNLFSRRRG